MKQKLTILNKNTKAIIVPNTLLKELDNPESFEMFVEDGRIILEPIKEPKNKEKKLHGDTSIDLYNMG